MSGTREPFGELQLVGMRCSPGVHPEFFIQSDGFDDERIAFPVADGVPVIRRAEIFRVLAAVHVDDAIRIRPAHVEDVDAFQILFHIHELSAVWRGKLAGNA